MDWSFASSGDDDDDADPRPEPLVLRRDASPSSLEGSPGGGVDIFDQHDRHAADTVLQLLRAAEDALYEPPAPADAPAEPDAFQAGGSLLERRHNFETMAHPQALHTGDVAREWQQGFPHLRVLGTALELPPPLEPAAAAAAVPALAPEDIEALPLIMVRRSGSPEPEPEPAEPAEPEPEFDLEGLAVVGVSVPPGLGHRSLLLFGEPGEADAEVLAAHGAASEVLAMDAGDFAEPEDADARERRRQAGLPPTTADAAEQREQEEAAKLEVWAQVVPAIEGVVAAALGR